MNIHSDWRHFTQQAPYYGLAAGCPPAPPAFWPPAGGFVHPHPLFFDPLRVDTPPTDTEKKGSTKAICASGHLIPLEDDCMFAAVMGNRDACTGFPEALFGGRRVRDVRFVHQKESLEVQRHFVFNPGGKSIRMDVYFEDSDAVYDMELQRTDEGDLPRRARMYSSYMDTGILGKGMDYRSLRDSYVIFVCRFDPFRLGEKLYHFETVDRGHEDLQAKDGRGISCS